MYRTRLLFALIYGCLTIILASACTNTPTTAPTTVPELTQATAQAIIQGETPDKEEVQTIELDNCGGKADLARTEERTQSIDVTISSEIAAEMGASAAVLTAEVQAAVGVAGRRGAQRNSSIQLVAPPDTRMVFQLVWVGNEQVGVVQNIGNSNIPIAFRSFLPSDVHIRGQYDMGCPGSSAPQPVFEPTMSSSIPLNTVTPPPTLPPVPATVVQSKATNSCLEFGGTPLQMSEITWDRVNRWRLIGQSDRNGTGIIIYCEIHQVPGYMSFSEGDTIPANVIITADLGYFWNVAYPNSLERLVHEGGGWGVFLSLKEFVVQHADDLNYPVGGQYWYIAGAN